MKELKKAFSLYSRLVLGDFGTGKELVDDVLSVLMSINNLLSAASKKAYPNNPFVVQFLEESRKSVSLISERLKGEGGEIQVENNIQVHDKVRKSSDHVKNKVQKSENERESEVEIGAQPGARNPYNHNPQMAAYIALPEEPKLTALGTDIDHWHPGFLNF